MKMFRKVVVQTTLILCCAVELNAQTEPLGGQPPAGAKQSVRDLDEQLAYQRAFEAVLWAMPASAVYRMRVGFLELPGMAGQRDRFVFRAVTDDWADLTGCSNRLPLRLDYSIKS